MDVTGTRARRLRAGFTLTELLVATAIFLILMSALVALFTSAVHSVRQGYASISVFEQGRVAMTTMSRDLTGAFTAREFGDVYNFYGRHDGFMFVGGLENGEIGRVSYVFHPDLNREPIQTSIRDKWEVMESNVRRQVARVAREAGIASNQVLAAENAVMDRIDNVYFYDDGVNTRPYNPKEYVDFKVELETQSLIRYEEPGVGDLDTFDMRVTSDGSVDLTWPYVDPIEPLNDAAPLPATDGDRQLEFLLRAVSPEPGVNSPYDLRRMFTNINTGGGWVHPVTNDQIYLRVLGPDFFDTVFRIRKRDFWLRMLSGENMSLPALQPIPLEGVRDYWYDERTGYPPAPPFRRTLNEYVVADGIVMGAYLIDPATGQRFILAPGDPVIPATLAADMLDAGAKFNYGDGNNARLSYFNAYDNLRDANNPDGVDTKLITPDGVFDSVPVLVGRAYYRNRTIGDPQILRGDLVEADSALADNLLGDRSGRRNMGSPLAPRIPALVTAEFWVTRSKRHAGAPDIIRRFNESIQLPAASGRTAPTTIALSPGGSL